MNSAHFINRFCLAAQTDCGRADFGSKERRAEQRSSVCTCSGTREEPRPHIPQQKPGQTQSSSYVPLSSDETQSLQAPSE